jgi:uncharacterized protein YfiM (DUF2279 family)
MSIFILNMILNSQVLGQNDLIPGRTKNIGDKTYLLLVFERDKWMGIDKIYHFGAGFVLEFGFEKVGMKGDWAFITITGLALFYEWYDMERGVGFSYKDALWSISGALSSYLINKYLFKR